MRRPGVCRAKPSLLILEQTSRLTLIESAQHLRAFLSYLQNGKCPSFKGWGEGIENRNVLHKESPISI